jgi:hypothetical protein
MFYTCRPKPNKDTGGEFLRYLLEVEGDGLQFGGSRWYR